MGCCIILEDRGPSVLERSVQRLALAWKGKSGADARDDVKPCGQLGAKGAILCAMG